MKEILKKSLRKWKSNHRKLNKNKLFRTKWNFKLSYSPMLIRNVGHLMTNPSILYDMDKEIPEGIMDTVITTMISIFDIKDGSTTQNWFCLHSKTKNAWIQTSFITIDLFAEVEKMLN